MTNNNQFNINSLSIQAYEEIIFTFIECRDCDERIGNSEIGR